MIARKINNTQTFIIPDEDIFYNRWYRYNLGSLNKKEAPKPSSKLLWKRINFTNDIWYYNNSDKNLSIEDFLIQKNQFILTPKYYTNGFVCISLDCTEIWHKDVSKRKTKISGNLEMWINAFKKI
jgi:hypothetical protein